MGKKCINCGRQLDDEDLFCKYCGIDQNGKNEFKNTAVRPDGDRIRNSFPEEDRPPGKTLSKEMIAVLSFVLAAAVSLAVLTVFSIPEKVFDRLDSGGNSTTKTSEDNNEGGTQPDKGESGAADSSGSGDLQGTAEYNGHRYKVFNEGVSWNEAVQRCESEGGHLITITSPGEQKFIVNLLESDGLQKCHYWLGGTDKSNEGKWIWITGEPFDHTNWDPGDGGDHDPQPNNAADQDYLELQTINNTGSNYMTWNDTCESGDDGSNEKDPWYYMKPYFGFICEWDE